MNEKELYKLFAYCWDDRDWTLEDYFYIPIMEWVKFVETCKENGICILWLEFLKKVWEKWIQPFDYGNYSSTIIFENWENYVHVTCNHCIYKIKATMMDLKEEWQNLEKVVIDFVICSEKGYNELRKKWKSTVELKNQHSNNFIKNLFKK